MHLNLQLNLEQLGPSYWGERPYYSLLIAAALQPESNESVTAADVDSLLRLWRWDYPELVVVGAPADLSADWAPLPHTVLTEAPPSGLTHLQSRLDTELDAQLATFAAGDFTWSAIGTSTAVETKAMPVGDEPRRGRDWRAFLSHLSTSPGGTGIHLRLTIFFHLASKPPEGTIVLAAPVLALPGRTTAVRPQPEADAGAITEVANVDPPRSVFRWDYVPDANLRPHAFVTALGAPAAPVPEALINLQTLWRQAPPAFVGPDEHWLASLPDRLAPAFSLPRPVIDELRTLGEAPVPQDFPPRVRRALFEVLAPAFDPVPISGDKPRRPIGGVHIQDVVLFKHARPEEFALPLMMPDTWLPLGQLPSTAAACAREMDGRLTDFSRHATLAQHLLILWKAAYRGDAWPALEKKLATEIDTLGRTRSLFTWLLSHQEAPFWPALLAPGLPVGGELAAIETRLKDALVVFARTALDDPSEELVRQLGLAASRTLRNDSHPAKDPTSDGLTVQVDRVAPTGPGLADDRGDYLRRISGAGVLLRRKGDIEWRCLNMAALVVGPRGSSELLLDDANDYAVPRRFHNQPFIPYQNQPVIAESPWSRMAPARTIASDAFPVEPLLSYSERAYVSGRWKLQRLMYGETYQIAVFYFSNAGAVPSACAADQGTATARPWRFVLPTLDENDDAATIVEHEYKRRCPVGPLRLSRDEAGPFPPPLPDRVWPLTTQLRAAKDAERLKADAGALTADAPADPLFVLTPIVSSASAAGIWAVPIEKRSFQVRPPSLDAKVWERWQPDITTDEERRQRTQILGEHFGLLNAHLLKLRLDEDDTLDDPAVGAFEVALTRMYPAPAHAGPFGPFPFGNPGGATGVKSQQRAGRRVVVMSSAAAQPTVSQVQGDVQVAIPNHEVWHVHLRPLVTAASRRRFTTQAEASIDISTDVTVEVAAPLYANDADRQQHGDALHRALTFTHVTADPATAREEEITVDLDAAKLQRVAPLLHRTELFVQRWRWDGRPVYEAPDATAPSGLPFNTSGNIPDGAHADRLDEMLFAEREDFEEIPGTVDLSSPRGNRLHSLKLTSMDGVLYYRLGVRAFSRYEGLLAPAHYLDSGAPVENRRRWRRYVVPLRWRQAVPKPLVKIVLPLTETIGAATVPGWQVTLDESWYSETLGGLGEYLESAIDDVALPDDAAQRRPQFGADPIIDMAPDSFALDAPTLPRPIGAVGYTFDTGSSAPLWVRSSFYQPPPQVQSGRDLAFHFAKLRFQRVIAGGDGGDATPMVSGWTDPYWVQILPPADRWWIQRGDGTRANVSIAEFRLRADGRLQVAGQDVVVLPTGSSVPKPSTIGRFVVYAFVSREAFDAFGRSAQDAFVTIVPVEELPRDEDVSRLPHDARRVRLVEMQYRLAPDAPVPTGLTQVAEALFRGYQDRGAQLDASGRIVRASVPITAG